MMMTIGLITITVTNFYSRNVLEIAGILRNAACQPVRSRIPGGPVHGHVQRARLDAGTALDGALEP
jgi:hypothetical protein